MVLPSLNRWGGGGVEPCCHRSSSLDDDLQRPRSGGVPKGLVGVEDVVELEVVRNEELGVYSFRADDIEQHRRADSVDQSRGDGDVAVPEVL